MHRWATGWCNYSTTATRPPVPPAACNAQRRQHSMAAPHAVAWQRRGPCALGRAAGLQRGRHAVLIIGSLQDVHIARVACGERAAEGSTVWVGSGSRAASGGEGARPKGRHNRQPHTCHLLSCNHGRGTRGQPKPTTHTCSAPRLVARSAGCGASWRPSWRRTRSRGQSATQGERGWPGRWVEGLEGWMTTLAGHGAHTQLRVGTARTGFGMPANGFYDDAVAGSSLDRGCTGSGCGRGGVRAPCRRG